VAWVPPAPVARALIGLPRPLRRAVIGGRRVTIDGCTLDRQLQLLLWAEARLGVPKLGEGSVEDARARFRVNARLLAPTLPACDVSDLTVAGAAGPLRARRYAPGPGTRPGLVYFHGGGWVVGDLDTHHEVCATLAVAAGVTVVAVDYRLAPEHPFPAPFEDAWAAFRDVIARAAELGLDPARIGVGGDSAGGNLSAAVALHARDAGGPAPKAQVLAYASVDQSRDYPSQATFARGFLLEDDDIAWFRARWLRDEDERDPRCSPLLHDLEGVAPAVVVTAGFDPLKDEGVAYAAKLRAAGVPVEERCERDLVHGFLNLAGAVTAARRALDDVAAATRRALLG
jgi:acetyl esterase